MKIRDKKYQAFFKNIRDNFKSSDLSIHKARNEVKIVEFEDEKFVVKSFKIPGVLKKIIYTFFKASKAKRSYDNSIRISSYTPKGIGYIEFKKYGLLADSYFVSEKYEYDFTIREPLEDSSFSDRENIFKAFVKFSYQLHNENVLHLDFSPGNILIKKDNNTYIFKIVDINRMEFKSLSIDERILNLSKLWAKDADMVFIAQEYAVLLGISDDYFVQKALDNSHKHKRFKNFKRRLKGKRVVE